MHICSRCLCWESSPRPMHESAIVQWWVNFGLYIFGHWQQHRFVQLAKHATMCSKNSANTDSFVCILNRNENTLNQLRAGKNNEKRILIQTPKTKVKTKTSEWRQTESKKTTRSMQRRKKQNPAKTRHSIGIYARERIIFYFHIMYFSL